MGLQWGCEVETQNFASLMGGGIWGRDESRPYSATRNGCGNATALQQKTGKEHGMPPERTEQRKICAGVKKEAPNAAWFGLTPNYFATKGAKSCCKYTIFFLVWLHWLELAGFIGGYGVKKQLTVLVFCNMKEKPVGTKVVKLGKMLFKV